MNENKGTKSIARKINNRNIAGLFSAFLVIDIIFVIFSICIWCYNAETSNNREFNIWGTRSFTTVSSDAFSRLSDTAKTENAYKSSGNDTAPDLIFPKSFGKMLNKSIYVYEISNGKKSTVYSGAFLVNLFSCIYLIVFAELLILISTCFSGTRKIRRHLEPLNELAFKAHVLGNTVNFDQQALDELEAAINSISPSKEGAHLHTGNAEMDDLEKAINALIDRMRDSYKQQSRFVSDASHELRTPISVLQGYVNMLDRWGKNDKQILDESITAIKSETEHMKQLIEQLLFLARGDSGKTKLNMKPFSLNNMMKEVYEESAMIDENHTYSFLPCKENIIVCGDISMLKQTARILIDNAAKYTPSGASILLKTDITDSNIPAFIIQDEGIGISGNDISHMFERFYRADPARAKDSGGTGLGLSIAKWIIDRHGGYFDILSREDIGTRITVLLPLQSDKKII